MRPIKFRGKRLNNGEWVYGSLTQSETHNKNGEPFMVSYIAPFIPVGSECGFELVKMDRVTPATVGQFTGLTDKNGKAIYEGDIIVFYELKTYCINPDCEPHLLGYSERLHKKIKAVKFEDGIFGVDGEYESIESLAYLGEWASDEDYMEEIKKDPYFDANGYDLDSIVGMEVVGNVFDNPELLEEKS